jgi:hypothetical protein
LMKIKKFGKLMMDILLEIHVMVLNQDVIKIFILFL